MEALAGPALAALALPTAMAMTGWVAFWGMSLGIARAMMPPVDKAPVPSTPVPLAPVTEPPKAQAVAVARLVVSNPVAEAPPAVVAKVSEAATPKNPAKPASPGAPPKPTTPGGSPPKPKMAAAEPVAATPKNPAKPASPGAPPKPTTPGGSPPKPKMAAKTLPVATRVSAKGISLPKVSMQDDKPETVSGKPKGLSEPRLGGRDDLKLIAGIGPKIETILNGLGIYHFDQIARWSPKEIAWVDGFLKFNGRILRDQWIGQADALAAGGEKEYVLRFGKPPR
jgi:NADH-quinone oxidoreductase subunit E